MDVNLTSGAISMIVTGKCTSKDLNPKVQLTGIANEVTRSVDYKKWHWVTLSDGYFFQIGLIAHKFFMSNMLHHGSIVQLTKFQLTKSYVQGGAFVAAIGSESYILVSDLKVLRNKCDTIGHPKRYLVNETPLVVSRATPTIPDEDHVDSLLNEDIDDVEEPSTFIQNLLTSTQKHDHVDSFLNEDNDDVEEPPTSIQDPSTSRQKCSSHSPTRNKKRKLQSSDDDISGFGTDISDVMKMSVEKTIEDGLGLCYRKLGTLEEGVSKMTRMMMEKNKEEDVSACFKKLETLEEDVSKMKKMTMEKNKEDDVGACFKKLETLEENVSKLTRMMMEKNKEDDMGACIEKLDTMGWGADEPIYDTTLLLFLKGADYRKLWLHLKPECCEKWVKIAGSISGLLD